MALVCAMGSNIAMPGFLYLATKALYEHGINVESFAQSLMQVNMQFVIQRDQYEEAVTALNAALCHWNFLFFAFTSTLHVSCGEGASC